MVFHWSFTDSKSPHVSRTLLSILAVLNNVVVWTVSTRSLISKSSSLFNNPLVTVRKASITIGIIVTFMFLSFFQFPSKVQVFILLFTFFQFYSVVSWDSKIHNFASSLFFILIIIRSDRLAVCHNPRGVCVCHSPGRILGCAYTICSYGQLSISFNIPSGSPLSTQVCLVLNSFCVNLQHLLIM